MIRTPFLHFASRSALIRCRVSRQRRHVQRDVVGAREQIVELDERDAGGVRRARRDERIVGDDAPCRRRARAPRPRWPMRPKPTTPSVLPRTSAPMNFFLSHSPCFIEASAAGDGARQRQHQAERQLGDADAVGAGGVHDEDAARAWRRRRRRCRRRCRRARSTRSFGAASISAAVTFVALRTISASASARSRASSSGFAAGLWRRRSIRRRAARRRRTAGRESAMTMCMSPSDYNVRVCRPTGDAPSWCKPHETSDLMRRKRRYDRGFPQAFPQFL